VLAKWNFVDILVNNACLCVFKSFIDRSLDRTRAEFEVNYFGAIPMIHAVLPHMKAWGCGIIHNVSSGVGISGFPGISGYVSTKGAIESLTRTLALEFAFFGICVNLMHPPLTNTKSASPLGIPVEMMADPEKVGRS
jgi:NAD(P)-dependent dehydrogenase (short-subunit alcohol dehydrogenase family)